MTRHEFSRKTKAAALARSGGRCEATGERYGLKPGERCNAELAVTGVQHDHWPLGAHAEGSNTIDNDVVCCPRCNQWAANHGDKQREQKIKDVRRHHGLDPDKRKPKPRMRSRGFAKGGPKQKIASRPFPERSK